MNVCTSADVGCTVPTDAPSSLTDTSSAVLLDRSAVAPLDVDSCDCSRDDAVAAAVDEGTATVATTSTPFSSQHTVYWV